MIKKLDTDTIRALSVKNNAFAFLYTASFFFICSLLVFLQVSFYVNESWILFIFTTYISGLFFSFLDQTAVSHAFQHNNVFSSKKLKEVSFVLIEHQFGNHYKNVNFALVDKYLKDNNFRVIKDFYFPTLHYKDILYKKN